MANKAEFPECPTLTEHGKKEAQAVIDFLKVEFEKTMKDSIESALSKCYYDIAEWVESDSWGNFRGDIISVVSGYKELSHYDGEKIRQKILEENKELLIKDLNQDMINEIKKLKSQVEYFQESGRNR